MHFYTGAFGEAGYHLFIAKGHSEALATVMANAYVPVLSLPRLPDTFRSIRSRSEMLRDLGLHRDAELLTDAGYLIGIQLYNAESAPFELIHRLIGLSLYDQFKNVATDAVSIAKLESANRMEDFRGRVKSMTGNWPDMKKFSESEYLWWDATRKNVGELEAAAAFAGK